ncbi:MAG: phosphopantetheine-binding protein [Azonexus sp.]|nr:phosphopantetheine-binding protein [Azonexus sp.]
MDILKAILEILDEELNLQRKALVFTKETKLRDSLPELDSMAIVNVISALEERFGFEFPEELLDGAIFESVGTLEECVSGLLPSR